MKGKDSDFRFHWRKLVVRDPHLTPAELRVLLELESFADPDGTDARPGILKIATNLRTSTGKHRHFSDRTVRDALAVGIERGFIELTFKRPRGRGIRLVDVYKLTVPEALEVEPLPCKCLDEKEKKDRHSGLPPIPGEKPAAQAATNTAVITGNSERYYRQSDDKYRQSGLPTTSPLPPDQITPDPSSSSVSIAREETRREENRRVAEEATPAADPPADVTAEVRIEASTMDSTWGVDRLFGQHPKPIEGELLDSAPESADGHKPPPRIEPRRPLESEVNPIEWVYAGVSPPMSAAEIATAEQMLTEGSSKYAVAQTIRMNRKSSRMPRRRAPVPEGLPITVPVELDPRTKDTHHANAAQN